VDIERRLQTRQARCVFEFGAQIRHECWKPLEKLDEFHLVTTVSGKMARARHSVHVATHFGQERRKSKRRGVLDLRHRRGKSQSKSLISKHR